MYTMSKYIFIESASSSAFTISSFKTSSVCSTRAWLCQFPKLSTKPSKQPCLLSSGRTILMVLQWTISRSSSWTCFCIYVLPSRIRRTKVWFRPEFRVKEQESPGLAAAMAVMILRQLKRRQLSARLMQKSTHLQNLMWLSCRAAYVLTLTTCARNNMQNVAVSIFLFISSSPMTVTTFEDTIWLQLQFQGMITQDSTRRHSIRSYSFFKKRLPTTKGSILSTSSVISAGMPSSCIKLAIAQQAEPTSSSFPYEFLIISNNPFVPPHPRMIFLVSSESQLKLPSICTASLFLIKSKSFMQRIILLIMFSEARMYENQREEMQASIEAAQSPRSLVEGSVKRVQRVGRMLVCSSWERVYGVHLVKKV